MYGSQKEAGEVFSSRRCRARDTLPMACSIGSRSMRRPISESLAVSTDIMALRGTRSTTSPCLRSSAASSPSPPSSGQSRTRSPLETSPPSSSTHWRRAEAWAPRGPTMGRFMLLPLSASRTCSTRDLLKEEI